MAGVKGRSGGARPNSGGARKGAGRKPKPKDQGEQKSANEADRSATKIEMEPQAHGGALRRSHAEPVPLGDRDMLQLLQDVALGRVDATALQVRAAIAAVQYTHTKKGDGGKKDKAASNAAKAAKGRFTPAEPPKLVSSR